MKLIRLLALMVFLPALVMAQQTIRGIVQDHEGNPLASVNVSEKGTRNGTLTNHDGTFSLRVSSSSATLIFSFIGYDKQIVALTGSEELMIKMSENTVQLSDVQVVGTRSYNRTITDTPVPVDIIDVDAVTARSGQLDVNQLLQYAAPSFNSNKQSGADGADHVDPATLRGLGPDQTLVLINGKRRHQSSLINIFGTRGRGNTGTDLNTIPAAAIERIEILRDGASAQYGSDAIAGVINIVLKTSTDELSGSVTAGASNADPGSSYNVKPKGSWDGQTENVSLNYGVGVGNGGFANFTADYLIKAKTNRPPDPAKEDIYRQKYGDASSNDLAFYVNSAVPLNNTTSFYLFGGINQRNSDAYAWTRDPGSERNVTAIYPNGFNPRITAVIADRSASAGFRSKLMGWDVDLSNTYGSNRFDYTIKGTLNASLEAASPTHFDAGGFQLIQNTTGLSFSKLFPTVMSGANVAFGAEYRAEKYELFAGEEGSYKTYGKVVFSVDGTDTTFRPGGSQGFPGFRPENELSKTRSNVGSYFDTELDVTRQWMMGAALRYEHYSDFGNTLTGKLDTRYKLSHDLTLRSSVSTGFRAPSLAQIYFNSTFTDFVAGVPVDKFIAQNNSAITKAIGIPKLKEEQATDITGGLTANVSNFSVSVDAYYVQINDRIVLTGAFDESVPEVAADLQTLGVGAVQFFTNAIDTKTTGLDVVGSWFGNANGHHLQASLAANFNKMELSKVHTTDKLKDYKDTYFGSREKKFLIASAPSSKVNLTLDDKFNRLSGNLQFVRFGEVKLEDWAGETDVYKAKVVTNLTVGYDITDNLLLSVGAANLFNVYPDQQDAANSEAGGIWDAVQMGFSGQFLFTKLAFKF